MIPGSPFLYRSVLIMTHISACNAETHMMKAKKACFQSDQQTGIFKTDLSYVCLKIGDRAAKGVGVLSFPSLSQERFFPHKRFKPKAKPRLLYMPAPLTKGFCSPFCGDHKGYSQHIQYHNTGIALSLQRISENPILHVGCILVPQVDIAYNIFRVLNQPSSCQGPGRLLENRAW